MAPVSKPCIVCGTPTPRRCSKCAPHTNLFFCSTEHQKLVWPVHSRVCGTDTGKGCMWPLTVHEAQTILDNRDVPFRRWSGEQGYTQAKYLDKECKVPRVAHADYVHQFTSQPSGHWAHKQSFESALTDLRQHEFERTTRNGTAIDWPTLNVWDLATALRCKWVPLTPLFTPWYGPTMHHFVLLLALVKEYHVRPDEVPLAFCEHAYEALRATLRSLHPQPQLGSVQIELLQELLDPRTMELRMPLGVLY